MTRAVAPVLSLARSAAGGLLVVATIVGAFALAAVPFGWILVVAKATDALALPPLVGLVVLLAAIPASMIAGVKLLLRISDAYERLRGNAPPESRRAPVWRRGLTDTYKPNTRRMLDVVMVVSVCVAVLALCAWFAVFAGSSINL